jgi:hypothetical protein
MQHFAMVKRLTHDRIPSPVANLNLLRPTQQEIHGELALAATAHFTRVQVTSRPR